jgi:hypothetical protein
MQDYPEIGELLDELKDSLFFRGRLHDNQGRLLGIAELDSVDKNFSLQLRILNGKLVPLSFHKDAHNVNGFSLTAAGCKRLYIAYDIHLNVVGLTLDIDSLQVSLDYNFKGNGLNLKACLVQPPEIIDAGGWAFGFIPLWLVDVLIPSNVEELTANFFQTLALGNDDQGTIISVGNSGSLEQTDDILIRANTEVLGNGTIKLAFNLQRKLLARQQTLAKEVRAFNNRLLEAFYQDYQRAKISRGCQ